ncbi:MAG: AsmA family protein [Deltaproteobacteria bacterium]|nr:AsmA family protein [Deltaproteobacteria bacterium]
MKTVIIWALLVLAGLIILCIAMLLLAPRLVDIQKYKPKIEKTVSESLGRPCRIDGDLALSLFPEAGVAFSGLHLGNPPGFEEKDFIAVKAFQVRVKLFPLLFKKIQIKRFVAEGPRIVLEKGRDGKGNWENLGKPEEKKVPGHVKEKPVEKGLGPGLPIKSLIIGDLQIKDGALIWINHASGDRREIKNLSLRLQDMSLKQPVRFSLSARLNEQPLTLDGKFGPVGAKPGENPVPLDFSLQLTDYLHIGLKGHVLNAADGLQAKLDIDVKPFSTRKLFTALGRPFPLKTADPGALTRLSFQAGFQGDARAAALKKAVLALDDIKAEFSGDVKNFSKPDIRFNLTLDRVDLDRYLPPPAEKTGEEEEKTETSSAKPRDYSFLRKLGLDGVVRAKSIKIKKARLNDVILKVRARDGIFRLNSLNLGLYQGTLSAKGIMDIRRDMPKSSFELQLDGMHINPLLKDMMEKDFIEGTTRATLKLSMEGDDARRIKRTLNGSGEVLFKDGAVKGINLAQMIRNVKTAFGRAGQGGAVPRTDFSELFSLFSVTQGVVDTSKTYLLSPIIRVTASGQANQVQETLNFRVEPKVVATLKGQGDTLKRAGVMVPVLIGGTFSKPTFKPDLKGMIKERIEKQLPEIKELQKIIQDKDRQQGDLKPIEEKAKGLIKDLFK